MWTTFRYTILASLREKWLLLWALAFPVILSTLFVVMLSGLDEVDSFSAPTIAVVVDDAYYAAPGFAQTMEAVSDGALPGARLGVDGSQGVSGGALAGLAAAGGEGSRGAGEAVGTGDSASASASASGGGEVLFVAIPVADADEALELVSDGSVSGYIAVDEAGTPGLYYTPGATDDPATSVVKAVLDAYVHGVAEVELVAQEQPLAMFDRATYQAFLGQDAVSTEQVSVTHSDPDQGVRYYYALLGMAAGMTAMISGTAVGRLRADVSPVGARQAVGGLSRGRLLTAVLAASWVCAFACLAVAYAYMRFVLGVQFGGRDALCLLALAVASFMACAAGGLAGACCKESSGVISGATCFLSLFAGLYGQPAMELADRVAQVAPWFSAINPVWQCARVFYDLLYYDSLVPFAQTCGVLVAMGLAFLALTVVRMRGNCESAPAKAARPSRSLGPSSRVARASVAPARGADPAGDVAPTGGAVPAQGAAPVEPATRRGPRGLSAFATCVRIIWGHRVYLIIYVVALSFMAVFIAIGSVPDLSHEEAVAVHPQVAVIDRDNSPVSRGLTAYLADRGELVELDDTERALQDAAAEDRVAYTVIVPEGYGDVLVEAAATGTQVPSLQTVLSYSGADGFLMDVQALGYLQAVYGFAATLGSGQEQAVALAAQATAHDADAAIARTQDAPPALRFYVYLTFATYPLFASVSLCIALLMRSLNERAVHQRLLVAPTRSVARGAQTLLACAVLGVAVWAWLMLVGTALFGRPILEADPARIGGAALLLLAYALFSAATGFLLGQLGVSEQGANMIANVGALVLSFLGGAWISMSLLPAGVENVARFTPTYWMVQGAEALLLRQTGLAEWLGDVGITLLFAVVVCLVALAIGRVRVREA